MLARPIEMAQECVRRVVRAGDMVVDATLGNGHDALFLAGLVGDAGKVIGFDVQQDAVESASERLAEAGIASSVCDFHHCGHQFLKQHVPAEVAAVMFNLGYLPRADKAVITTAETTLPALQQALAVIREGGVVTVMCYPGHEGGDVEAEAVTSWAAGLPRSEYRVVRYGMINAPNRPAFLVAIEKQTARKAR